MEVRAGEGSSKRASHHDVAPSMKRQVVGAGKASVAVGAAKGFDAGVLAKVPRQLVRTGEAPCATFPSALVWLFTCKGIMTSVNATYIKRIMAIITVCNNSKSTV